MLCFLLILLFYSMPLMGQFNPFNQMGLTGAMPPAAPIREESDEPDSGNWYEKLHWWKEAKRVYTIDIHEAMEHLKIIEQEYDKKKQTLFGQLDTYYKSIPAERNAAPAILASLIEETKKELEPFEEPIKPEQQAQVTRYQDQLKTMEGLKSNVEQFNELIKRLEQAINNVFPQEMQSAHSYDKTALENFERTENVFDDEKAQNYFNVIENSLDNIRDITTYLVGPLQIFIDQVWGKIQILMPQLKKSIEDLEKQDIHIRVLSPKEKAERDELLKKREEARLKALAEKKAEEARKAMSWWQKIVAAIGSFFSSIFNGIKSMFSSIGGLFSSRAPVKQAPPKKPEAPTKKPEAPKPVAHA